MTAGRPAGRPVSLPPSVRPSLMALAAGDSNLRQSDRWETPLLLLPLALDDKTSGSRVRGLRVAQFVLHHHYAVHHSVRRIRRSRAHDHLLGMRCRPLHIQHTAIYRSFRAHSGSLLHWGLLLRKGKRCSLNANLSKRERNRTPALEGNEGAPSPSL